MRRVLLFFILVPFAEMLLLFEVAEGIGGLPTLGLVILTAVVGVQILKQQGLSTLLRANERIRSGELPAQEIIEGMLLAGAGALLLTPGFLTDILGFSLLMSPLRQPIANKIIRSGTIHSLGAAKKGGFGFSAKAQRYDKTSHNNVYEGEFTEEGLDSLSHGDDSTEISKK